MDERISIIITERRRLTTTRIVLGSLFKNSHFKDHEIVFVGDRIDDPVEPSFKVGRYKTLRNYLKYWQKKFPNFSLHEGDWNRRDVDPPNQDRTPVYECFNYGIDRASNDWIMTTDSDEFFCKDWDVNIIKRFSEYDPASHVFVPVYGTLQHPHGDGVNGPDPNYHPDDHHKSKGYAAKYIPRKEWKQKPLLESELNKIWETRKVDDVCIEACAERRHLFWWNLVINKQVMEKMKGITVGAGAFGASRAPGPYCSGCRYTASGGHGHCDEKICIREMHSALDLEFDDLLTKVPVKKVGCLDSMVFHVKTYRCSGEFLFDFGEP